MPTTSPRRQNVVIFAGAGASRALKDSTFPTTVEFFEALPDAIRGDAYFAFVEQFVRRSKDHDVIDIEEILLELQNLASFLRSANDRSTIVGDAVAVNLLAHVNRGYNFGHLAPGGAELLKRIESLQGRINAQVFRLYRKEPTDRELDDTWNPLLSNLIDKSNLNIFTTNYDIVIENALASLASEAAMYKWLGATGRAQKRLDLEQWREDAKRSFGLLTKLHGSLTWKLDDDEILLGDWAFTGNHAKQAIIYPGFKGRSDAVFFDPFHEYLSRTLAKAHHVLVIGFAFRDDSINQIFRASMNPAATVTVMDLNESLAVPVGRKPRRLRGFDGAAVATFLKGLSKA